MTPKPRGFATLTPERRREIAAKGGASKNRDPATRSFAKGSELAVKWFDSKLNVTLAEVQDHFTKFRISDALNAVYKLIWDDFCAQYLEMIKPAYEQPIDKVTFEATLEFFDQLMRLVHPFMPFISEEIWQNIREREANDSICIAPFPQAKDSDAVLLSDFEILFELISGIRNLRNSKNISPKVALPLAIRTDSKGRYETLEALIVKLAHIETITYVTEESEGTSFRVKSDEFFVNLADELDVETERENLQRELEYTQGFLDSVIKKLSNERFVANAKGDIVEKERQKQADAEAKIVTLKEALVRLG